MVAAGASVVEGMAVVGVAVVCGREAGAKAVEEGVELVDGAGVVGGRDPGGGTTPAGQAPALLAPGPVLSPFCGSSVVQ